MSVRVVAPCRLHFGLFHVPVDGLTHHPDGRPVLKFGGLGLMIEWPRVLLLVHESLTPHPPDQGKPELRSKGDAFLKRIESHYDPRIWSIYRPGFKVIGVEPHTGMGVGTALGLGLAAGVDRLIDYPAPVTLPRVPEYARWVDRGNRSGIGLFGFQTGGFIADDGKIEDELPQLGCRLDFPSAWRVVLVRPPLPPMWHGDRERSAFARTRPADRALSLTDRLRSLAYDTVIPAVRTADFDTFAQSLFEFNRLAGEPFHDDQGGPYAGVEVACVIDELMEMGAVGVGQSSWGPTVFAMCRDADEAESLANRARARFSSATEVIVTAANNTGARIETL